MKRLSVSLLLVASLTACFAACSSSDDSSSPSGGSSGNGGAPSGAGAGGKSGASSSNAGQSGESGEQGEGGVPNAGASGHGDRAGEAGMGGAGAEPSGTSGTTSGGSTSGGGTSNGVGGSGGHSGNVNGGAAGSPDGGTAGENGVACGSAARAAFASGLTAYFAANVAKQACVLQQTHGAGSPSITECSANGCSGNPGCAASFTWHDATYDAATGNFSVKVDLSTSLGLTTNPGGATCTLSASEASVDFHGSLGTLDSGSSLSVQLTSLNATPGAITETGCGTVTSAGSIADDDLTALVSTAQQDAVTTLVSYRVDCAP